ncbi:MAG TPA: alcohol dehydrogenase catalytic domain-containing protein [Desulfomonilaceae bacterium]|nr:alcohol dehydrogenase catalytic domain-containing protein [Desulfomonilaceae bacterium]
MGLVKALVFREKLALEEVPKAIPGPGEALIKVSIAGICKTDVEISRGYMDFQGIPGHEFVGIVESSPDPRQVGTRVVGEINVGCGNCSQCRQGLERHCLSRTVLGILGRNGAFAEYLTLPASNLVCVPASLPDEKAVFVEPLAAALEILDQVAIRPTDRVLVIGDGKLGLLVSMALRPTGCDLQLVGKHPRKLDLFARLGGSVQVLEHFSGSEHGFDVVVEASGHPSGWEFALKMVKPRGTIVLKSTFHGSFNFNPAPLVINEITVVGSRCGKFAPALRLMESGIIDPTPLISGSFRLEDIEEAFKRSVEKEYIKVLVKMT